MSQVVSRVFQVTIAYDMFVNFDVTFTVFYNGLTRHEVNLTITVFSRV